MEQTEKRETSIEPCHIELCTGQIVIFWPCREQPKNNDT